MSDIQVFLPKTADDVYALEADIMRCILAEEGIQPDEDIIDWLAENPHCLYIFYDGPNLVGMIRLDDREVNPAMGGNTVQIHGSAMPDYYGKTDAPSLFTLRHIFKTKKTVIAKVSPDNLGARGWVLRWRFQRINWERGKVVYRLKRSEFLRRQNVIREQVDPHPAT